MDSVMLLAELAVEVVLELAQWRVLVAGNGNRGRLVLGGVCLDVVLEGIVVDVVCEFGDNDRVSRLKQRNRIAGPRGSQAGVARG